MKYTWSYFEVNQGKGGLYITFFSSFDYLFAFYSQFHMKFNYNAHALFVMPFAVVFLFIFYFKIEKCGDKDRSEEMFSFVIEVIEAAIKSWHETSTVLPRVNFLLDKDKTDTTVYAPVVKIDQVLIKRGCFYSNAMSYIMFYPSISFCFYQIF